jgi:hypothetical protein
MVKLSICHLLLMNILNQPKLGTQRYFMLQFSGL